MNKYEFVVIDIDDEPMFNYLITYSIGRFDSPGIFVIEDMQQQKYYRNYEIYDGATNFNQLSAVLISEINNKTKSPLYSFWVDSLKNCLNFEHWNNNRLKSYMYVIGLTTVAILPFIVLIDCFFPVFGRGPNSKRKTEEHKEQSPEKAGFKEKHE